MFFRRESSRITVVREVATKRADGPYELPLKIKYVRPFGGMYINNNNTNKNKYKILLAIPRRVSRFELYNS